MIRRVRFPVMLAILAYALIASAQPIPFDVTNYDMSTGDIGSMIRNQTGSQAMALGSVVHVIMDSLNDGIDAPTANGMPTGDDRLCQMFRVGVGSDLAGVFYATLTAYRPTEAGPNNLVTGRQFYLRAFNTTDTTIPAGTWYTTSIRSAGLPAIPTDAETYIDGWLWTQSDSTVSGGQTGVGGWNQTAGIIVTAPATGATVNVGSQISVLWNAVGVTGNVNIELNRDYPNGTWSTITTVPATPGSYSWLATPPATANAAFRVTSVAMPAIYGTSGIFRIRAPGVVVARPNGSETLVVGTSDTISWDATDVAGNVSVELNRTYPTGQWEVLGTPPASNESLIWTVAGATSTTARVRVMSGTIIGDTSNANFTITAPSFSNIYPGLGATDSAWTWDATTIMWNSQYITGNVRIELNRNYPTGAWVVLFANTTNDGLESWTPTMPGTIGATARVRITSITDPTISAMSANGFVIMPSSINVTAPNTAVTWYVGDTGTVQWGSSFNMPPDGTVRIQINRDYPTGAWTTVVDNTPNDGTQAWVVTGPVTTTARIRVLSTVDELIVDESDVNFTVQQRSILVTVPNGAEMWRSGTNQNITWSSVGINGNVDIHINRNYSAGVWEPLFANTANDGSEAWTVAGALTAANRIRVRSVTDTTIFDISDANFTTFSPTLTLTAPNSGTWYIGNTYNVTWTSGNMDGNILVELNRNYPAGTWTTLATVNYLAGTYAYPVTGPATTTARFRVTSVNYPASFDTSNANITIAQHSITVVAPNGGEVWSVGDDATIRWTTSGFTGPVRIDLNRNHPTGSWVTIIPTTPNDSIQTWTVTIPSTNTALARIRIVQLADTTIRDSSDANFTIAPKIVMASPNGGETFTTGIDIILSWNRFGGFGLPVEVQLNRSYPSATWETIGTNTVDTLVWTPTTPANTTTARMRVRYVDYTSICDTSNANFSIIVNGLDEYGNELPKVFALNKAYPNPFNATTSFKVAVPRNADVRIALYNTMGQKVTDLHHGSLKAGYHLVTFNASQLSSGSYIVRMDAPGFTNSQMIQLVK